MEIQAAELLHRCERLANRTLIQARGNLRNARTRANAVWELLVAEAAAQIGQVELEPPGGGPDLRLLLPTGRHVSIEVAYVRPRFEEQERRWSLVQRWVAEEADRMQRARVDIDCRFEGERGDGGTKLTLPAEHEKRKFLSHPDVVAFFSALSARPDVAHSYAVTGYSLVLKGSPNMSQAKARVMSGGRPSESPIKLEEHAAYRAVKTKLKQHDLDEPHIVCLGGDTSSALSSIVWPTSVPLTEALAGAVRNSHKLAGIFVVRVEYQWHVTTPKRKAVFSAYRDTTARHPLSEEEWAHLMRLDFNRWDLGWPLQSKEPPAEGRIRHLRESIRQGAAMDGTVNLTIPASLLVDVLSGRRELMKDFSLGDRRFADSVYACLEEGWTVVETSVEAGDIQTGRAAVVHMKLAPPHDYVFWPVNRKLAKGSAAGD